MNRKMIRRQLPSLLLTVLFSLAWELPAQRMNAAYILPSPTQILRRIYELQKSPPLVHLLATMAIAAILLLLSLLPRIFLAILMDQSKTTEWALYPLLVASQTVLTTALAPLFVLWLGYSIWSKVFAAVLMTFFPIAITLSDGFCATPPKMTELMQTLGMTQWQFSWKLKLPAVLPSFFAAIRMAVSPSVISAAIGKWFSAQVGLGYFSRRMITQLDGMGVFASIVFLSITAILFTALA